MKSTRSAASSFTSIVGNKSVHHFLPFSCETTWKLLHKLTLGRYNYQPNKLFVKSSLVSKVNNNNRGQKNDSEKGGLNSMQLLVRSLIEEFISRVLSVLDFSSILIFFKFYYFILLYFSLLFDSI